MDAMGIELAEQLGVWRALWKRRDEIAALAGQAVRRGFGRVVFTGCGDCHAAAEYGAAFLGLRSRLDVRALPAMELARGTSCLPDEDTLVVCLSVSGRTPRALEAARAARRRGALVLAVTDNPEGPVAREAECCFLLGASPADALQRTDYADPAAAEYSGYHRAVPQTKTYGAVELALALLCLKLEESAPSGCGASRDEVERCLAALPDLGKAAEGAAADAALRLGSKLRPGAFLTFCGTGLGYSAARFSAYKLLELATAAAFSEVEEYCHTYYLVTGATDGLVLFAQSPLILGRAREIAPVVSGEIGASVAVISTCGAERPWELGLPGVPSEVSPLLFAHAGAHLVRRLAGFWGINTDRFRAGVEEERYVSGSTRMIRQSEILEL
jgi:fructoselysine-6-P-deglycase FrlB-like protein